jgi:predicted polyphosphate/ATP-dependent NAD kinase
VRPLPVSTIGIIANPVSARDIRRIVAHAGNLQIADRVNIVLRVLAGAAAAGVQRALLMPDRGGIRALLQRHLRYQAPADGLPPLPQIEFLDMEPRSTVDDTFTATRKLRAAGVGVIVVLGGDGTHRAVVKELVEGAIDAPAMPPIVGLSTGTNNAFPESREPTIAGLAAGFVACGRIAAAEALRPNKLIEVTLTDARGRTQHDVAIVDAVVTHDRTVGARALWKPQSLHSAYLAFAEPQAIGLSAIGGLLQPVGRGEPGGLALQIAHTAGEELLTLNAPIAPGLVCPVSIAGWQRIAAGEPHTVALQAGTVALDGEREWPFDAGTHVQMILRERAFHTVDISRCLAIAARDGLLRSSPPTHR